MAIEAHVCRLSGGKRAARSPDEVVTTLAAARYGVVARSELLAAGVGADAIDGRIASGMLQPLHRGVYAVGHRALRREGWSAAAVIAAGAGAALSYRSVAELWAIRQDTRARIEVSVPRHRRSAARLEVHVVAMRPDEVVVEDGIRVTCPAHALRPRRRRHRRRARARVQRGGVPPAHQPGLPRCPPRAIRGRRGTAAIRRVLENHRRDGETGSRSELERELARVLDAYGLPRPIVNRHTEHGELEATWPEQRLVVEVDGWAAHGTRRAFEQDRARDRALVVAGWRVVRTTWRQLSTEPDAIAAQLATLLGQPSASSLPAQSSTARSWAA